MDNKQTDINKRYLDFEGTTNFRDLGGYVGHNSKTVKWGQIFRADALNKLTDKDITLLEAMKLKTIVDFRSPKEIVDNEDKAIKDTVYFNLNPKAEVAQLASASPANDKQKIDKLLSIANSDQGERYFLDHIDDMAKQMRKLVSDPVAISQYQKLMELLLADDGAPLVYHCRGGKDRTGVATMFILLALGVSKDQIYSDYILTNTYKEVRNEMRMDEYRNLTDNQNILDYLRNLLLAKEEYLDAAFDEMIKVSGSSDNYLRQVLMIDDDKLTTLRNRYLEG